jgi:hypothetical protein
VEFERIFEEAIADGTTYTAAFAREDGGLRHRASGMCSRRLVYRFLSPEFEERDQCKG